MFSVMTKCFHFISIAYVIVFLVTLKSHCLWSSMASHYSINICEKKFENQTLFCHLVINICTQVFCLLQVLCQSTPDIVAFFNGPHSAVFCLDIFVN